MQNIKTISLQDDQEGHPIGDSKHTTLHSPIDVLKFLGIKFVAVQVIKLLGIEYVASQTASQPRSTHRLHSINMKQSQDPGDSDVGSQDLGFSLHNFKSAE